MFKPTKLLFGTAGIPLSTPRPSTENGIRHVKKLKLDAMELEFVNSVNISAEKAPVVKKISEENNVILTCHGQYFVNLNALEKPKMYASINRILAASRIVNAVGGWSIAYHMAFYLGKSKEETYGVVKENVKKIIQTFKDEGIKIWLRPELTGKESQWGDLDEILRLSSEFDLVMPCIDYGHAHARYGGKKNNTYEEFCKILEEIEKVLGKEGLNNMHIQIEGINYTEKGERNHLNLEDKGSTLNWRPILKSWKDFNIKGVVIAESPNVERDSILLKKTFESL